MSWLVTGGAGYIGSHVVRALMEAGIEPVVVDDLSTGLRRFVPPGVRLVEGSVLDEAVLDEALAGPGVDGVIHLAGYKYAGESVKRPLHTYDQNVTATVGLVRAMLARGVTNMVFSSSAAVFGTPTSDDVREDTPTAPESPYGETKLISEWILRDAGIAHDLAHTSLRYFNVVGSGRPDLFDVSPPNLFPLVFDMLYRGDVPRINGADYPTPDGTCVRDYVHVTDLATSHVAAAARMMAGRQIEPVYNLGSGEGYSVREVMDTIREVTGVEFEPTIAPRRPGDPARIVASGALAARDLDWAMRHNLRDMVASAWEARQQAGDDYPS